MCLCLGLVLKSKWSSGSEARSTQLLCLLFIIHLAHQQVKCCSTKRECVKVLMLRGKSFSLPPGDEVESSQLRGKSFSLPPGDEVESSQLHGKSFSLLLEMRLKALSCTGRASSLLPGDEVESSQLHGKSLQPPS